MQEGPLPPNELPFTSAKLKASVAWGRKLYLYRHLRHALQCVKSLGLPVSLAMGVAAVPAAG